jgi:hypothetical protein
MSAAPSVAPAVPEITWTAGAVARMLAIPPSTLRGWHRRYDIPPMGVRGGRHRRYTDAEVKALARMKQLIADGVGAQSAADLAFHRSVRAEVDARDVVAAAMRLDTDALVSMLDSQLTAGGVIDTWDRVCCPALNSLGGVDAEDVDGCVDVVHLLSWAITASLHRLTVGADLGRSDRPPVLLACTSGERHVLPLEVLHAELSLRGVATRLLGTDIPDAALRDALRRVDPAPATLVLWAHSRDTARTTLRGDKAVRVILAGPGWPRRADRPTSLADAVELLTAP